MRTVLISDIITNPPDNEYYAGINKVTRLNQFHDAIGYLSTWAMFNEKYCNVEIIASGTHGDLIANYQDKDHKHTYQIGAVWRDGEYSFHS